MTEKRIYGTISLSGFWNWFNDTRAKYDINNIKRYEDIVNDYDRDCDADIIGTSIIDKDNKGTDGTGSI